MWNTRHDLAEDGLPGVHPASDLQKRPPCSNREQALNAPTPCENAAYITLSPTKWDSIGDDPLPCQSDMTTESKKNLPASVRQRLLNLRKERKEPFDLLLVRYGIGPPRKVGSRVEEQHLTPRIPLLTVA